MALLQTSMALSLATRSRKHRLAHTLLPDTKVRRVSDTFRTAGELAGEIALVADEGGPCGLKQVIPPDRLQCHILLYEKGLSMSTMKSELLKAVEKCLWNEFVLLYEQKTDYDDSFPVMLDVLNASMKRLYPKTPCLSTFTGCNKDPSRAWNYSWRHISHAFITYLETPSLLDETSDERAERLELITDLYCRVVAEGVQTLKDAVGGMEALGPDVHDMLQSLWAGTEEALLDFAREWSRYIHTVKLRNCTVGHPFTIDNELNTADDVLEHVKLFEQAIACQPDLVQGLEGLSTLSLAYVRAAALKAKRMAAQDVAAQKVQRYKPLNKVIKRNPHPPALEQEQSATGQSAATSEEDSYFGWGDPDAAPQ